MQVTLVKEIPLDFSSGGPTWSPDRVFVYSGDKETRLEFSYRMVPTEETNDIFHCGNPVAVGKKSFRVMSIEVSVPLVAGHVAALSAAAKAINHVRSEILGQIQKVPGPITAHYGSFTDSILPQVETALAPAAQQP